MQAPLTEMEDDKNGSHKCAMVKPTGNPFKRNVVISLLCRNNLQGERRCGCMSLFRAPIFAILQRAGGDSKRPDKWSGMS